MLKNLRPNVLWPYHKGLLQNSKLTLPSQIEMGLSPFKALLTIPIQTFESPSLLLFSNLVLDSIKLPI